MTNKQAKTYIISQRNVNMATDNQHGVDACNKAIKALDILENIELIIQSFRDESQDMEDAFYEICKEVEDADSN